MRFGGWRFRILMFMVVVLVSTAVNACGDVVAGTKEYWSPEIRPGPRQVTPPCSKDADMW